MKQLLAGWLLFLAAAPAFGQANYRITTYATPPSADALDRLALKTDWRLRLPIHGNRDGLSSLEVIPDSGKFQLLAQTYGGRVILIDADTGDVRWQADVGTPFWESQPPAHNTQAIFVTRRNMLHVLGRKDGLQRVFTTDKLTKVRSYGFEMQGHAATRPVADEENFYLVRGNNSVVAYAIPDFEREARAKRKIAAIKDADQLALEAQIAEDGTLTSLQPRFFWSLTTDQPVLQPPLLAGKQITLAQSDGIALSVNRFEGVVRRELRTADAISVAMAQSGSMAYLASNDTFLYALDMESGFVRWRFIAGTPPENAPESNDRDVYHTARGRGLHCLDRKDGTLKWVNPQVRRFLAANNRYVYTLDGGMMYVLDQMRGTSLAKCDISSWNVITPNPWTDRLYLAGHDGQIMCLRHRDLPQALVLKTNYRIQREEEFRPGFERKEEKKVAPEAVEPMVRLQPFHLGAPTDVLQARLEPRVERLR